MNTFESRALKLLEEIRDILKDSKTKPKAPARKPRAAKPNKED